MNMFGVSYVIIVYFEQEILVNASFLFIYDRTFNHSSIIDFNAK